MDLTVGTEHAGERLDVFLARSTGSRSAAQRLIEAGAVLVDGRERPKRHAVSAGERVQVAELPAEPEADVPDAAFAIAWEDEHLLVVDKPAGVVVHPGAGHRAGTLVQALAGRVAGGDDPERPGVVHRLDRDTSGLLAARALGRGPRGAAGRAAGARDRAHLPRARRGPPRRAARHDRRPAGARPARAHPHEHGDRRPARRGHALRGRAQPAARRRCCGCGWRPAARTRSAPT